MARLLTVVNERKKLRSEYRRILEDEYIAKKKAEELAEQKAELERLKEQGIKVPPTPDEIKEMIKARALSRKDTYENKLQELKDKIDKTEQYTMVNKTDTATSPLLEERDLKLVAQTQSKLTPGDILRMYVKNAADLDLKQKRQVMAKIQSQRAMHAKEIFLKELSALGRKMKKQEFAKDDASRIKDKKDPLKLKLESLSLVDVNSTNEKGKKRSKS